MSNTQKVKDMDTCPAQISLKSEGHKAMLVWCGHNEDEIKDNKRALLTMKMSLFEGSKIEKTRFPHHPRAWKQSAYNPKAWLHIYPDSPPPPSPPPGHKTLYTKETVR